MKSKINNRKSEYKVLFTLLLLIFIGMSACTSNNTSNDENLKEVLATSEIQLIDVRTPEEFTQGTVPNAINIPLQELELNLSQLEKNKTIILFCRSGSRSAQALEILNKNGFQNAKNGGAWSSLKALIENQ